MYIFTTMPIRVLRGGGGGGGINTGLIFAMGSISRHILSASLPQVKSHSLL